MEEELEIYVPMPPKESRKVLFTRRFTFKTSELKRRKPFIDIDRRTLDRIEDDSGR